MAIVGLSLVACSIRSSSATPTLNFYLYPDNSGAVQQAVDNCNAASNGAYTIKYQKLPNGADGQRQQMVRRLAAKDISMDILGLDVTWAPEFAEAGWILRVDRRQQDAGRATARSPGPLADRDLQGQALGGPVQQQHPAAVVPLRPGADAAQDVGRDDQDGRAAGRSRASRTCIEIQGNQYEGITVWFNTLLASAGGSVLNAGRRRALAGPAGGRRRCTIMQQLATSPAADPSLSVQMEDDNRLAMESGTAAFELNYPFVYPSMKDEQPELFENFKWAPYPAVERRRAGQGDDRRHQPGGQQLLEAPGPGLRRPRCASATARTRRSAAIEGGVPPSLGGLYDDPELARPTRSARTSGRRWRTPPCGR